MLTAVEKARIFLADNNIDYLLVNSTNEFLAEYTKLEENARYALTNFSGSTGDAVVSKDFIWLFVDGRYHQQADLEINSNIVSVVKMQIGESFSSLLEEKLSPDSKIAVVSRKNSIARINQLKKQLSEKNISVLSINFDPILDSVNGTFSAIAEKVPLKISGLSADEKFVSISKKIQKNEAILTTNSEEISYFCNLRDFSISCASKINGKCLISIDRAVLFSDYSIDYLGENFHILPTAEFEKYIADVQFDKIFIDESLINAYDYSLIEKKAHKLQENYLSKMKSIKTDSEINYIKECFEKADSALVMTRNFIENNDNISEFDISQELEKNFKKTGARNLSFKSIVAKDQNSALAHYSKSSKEEIIKNGSLILIDCGAYYDGGFATDATRVFVKGEPSKLQKKVYTSVLKAFLNAFNFETESTTTGFDLDNEARNLLSKIAPSGFAFSHSLGHGIGINVHESPPSLSPSAFAKTVIEKNMCFTIEPGLYKSDCFGIRLENSCYMDEISGKKIIKSFSKMPFEQKLIEYDMLNDEEKKQLDNFKVL